MKAKLFLAFLFLSTCAMAQKNVAVYVTGDEQISSGVKKVFGSELVSAIVKNNEYKAVERTSEFLNVISREQGYQHSGNVEDSQISELGKQFGVGYVCVVEITDLSQPSDASSSVEYYIQARLIDVEKATIVATARESFLKKGSFSSSDIVKTAEKLAYNLIGKETVPIGYDYSTYLTKNGPGCTILEIDNTGADTQVSLVYLSQIKTSVCISPATYIMDDETGVKYMLLSAEGIAVKPQTTDVGKGTRNVFTLHFKKIPSSSSIIHMVEPDGWKFVGISLKPYGKQNYFLFSENTSALQQEAKQLAGNERLQRTSDALTVTNAALGMLSNSLNEMNEAMKKENVYELTVMNTHSSPRNIYIRGKLIGKVAGYGSATFKLSLDVYGNAESVQTTGYVFSPSREFTTIPRQNKGAKITWRL